MVQLVLKAATVVQENREKLDPKDQRVILDHKVLKGLRVFKGFRDQRVILEIQDIKVPKVFLDYKGHRELKDLKELRGLKGAKVKRVTLE
jgi:hypothetical protein